MGATTCDDNRFEAIAKAREMLVSSTNIEDSPDEMAVLDTILFRFWQMGWIDALDVNVRLNAENAKLRDLALNCYRMAKAHATERDCRTRCSRWPECKAHDTMAHAEPCELAMLARELGIEVWYGQVLHG